MPAGPWQPFVDDILVGSGYCSAGVIVGTDGEIYAYSPCLNITREECKRVADVFAARDNFAFQSNGVMLSGAKYFCLRAMLHEGLVYGKKGPAGLCMAESDGVIIIGIYSDGMIPGECNLITENLSAYLSGGDEG
ncbi:Profilin-2 [Diplonema papillatum]|nr:Profilin-2 [Diplonema papillatum]